MPRVDRKHVGVDTSQLFGAGSDQLSHPQVSCGNILVRRLFTGSLSTSMVPRLGQATVVDPADMEGLQKALDAQQCTLFFSESPTNPYLRCIDVELVSKMCHDKGCIVCIDGTFATPINQRAIAQGADLVLHSATKYIAGACRLLLASSHHSTP